jgi:hypothetical protein
MVLEEHRAAQAILADVDEVSLEDPRWSARVNVLNELVEHHVEEYAGDHGYPIGAGPGRASVLSSYEFLRGHLR